MLWTLAMAITQIHTHRRNRHGSWRDGEGGALDATRPGLPERKEAPTQRRQRNQQIRRQVASEPSLTPGHEP